MAYNPRLGSEPASPMRVFVLAEDALAADALRRLLESDARLAIAASGAEADVVLWDLGVDPARSLALQKSVLCELQTTHAVILALVPDELSAAHALQQGARGVLQRRCPAQTLTAALVAVRLGLCVLDADIAEHYIELPKPSPHDVATASGETLTAREREVLELLALGISNRAIAERLAVSVHTVKFHVNSILAKLNVETRAGAVAHGLRRGLVTT
jgi:two-component system nitrate/nitrite response regulator NarL